MSSATHTLLHGEDLSIAVVSCDHKLGCGCKGVSDCCFKCPLEYCRFGVIGGVRAIRAVGQNTEIVKLHRQGKSVRDISEQLKVSRRVIQRVLRKNNE